MRTTIRRPRARAATHTIRRVVGQWAENLDGTTHNDPSSMVSMVVKNKLALPAGGEWRERDVPVFSHPMRIRDLESLLVLPLYVPMLAEFGRTHLQVTVERGDGPQGGRGLLEALAFYPRNLVRQIGIFTLVPGLAGLLTALRPARRRACWPYLGLAAATYLAFAPLAELQVRHSIYWVPAFALFAVEGIDWLAGRLSRW